MQGRMLSSAAHSRGEIGKGLKARNFKIGPGGRRFDSPDIRIAGRTVHPDSADAKRFAGDYVVVNTLRGMQPVLWSDSHSGLREFKHLARRLVSPGLRSGDHEIEINFEVRGSGSEEIVVNV